MFSELLEIPELLPSTEEFFSFLKNNFLGVNKITVGTLQINYGSHGPSPQIVNGPVFQPKYAADKHGVAINFANYSGLSSIPPNIPCLVRADAPHFSPKGPLYRLLFTFNIKSNV